MSTTASAIVLAGRVLFVALFAFSARGHIVNHGRFVTTAKGRLPVPYMAGWPTGVWLLLANSLARLLRSSPSFPSLERGNSRSPDHF